MGFFTRNATSAAEQWRFMNEKDPGLFGRSKPSWRAEKAARQRLADKQAKAHGKGKK